MQRTGSSAMFLVLFLTNATAFIQWQISDLRLQGLRNTFLLCDKLHARIHTHKDTLEHKEYAPQVKKDLWMGQHSVPRLHAESSLTESWLACLAHGLRSYWFPGFPWSQIAKGRILPLPFFIQKLKSCWDHLVLSQWISSLLMQESQVLFSILWVSYKKSDEITWWFLLSLNSVKLWNKNLEYLACTQWKTELLLP